MTVAPGEGAAPDAAAAPATEVEEALRELLRERRTSAHDAATIPAADVRRLVEARGLGGPEALALLALPLAARLARAPISGYRVAVVGIDDRGDLILGGNLEFPGTDLGTTVHAEGFVALRARRRGAALAVLASRDARPCAHCRQTLSESDVAGRLVLVDLDGSRRTLADLYPLPFLPATLGIAGDRPGRVPRTGLALAPDRHGPEAPITMALLEAGSSAHAPYSGAPSAVAVRLRDGRVLAAGCFESVSFNPSISAAQAALVELAAVEADPADIEAAWLAAAPRGTVDPEPGFRVLLGAVAPGASLGVVHWSAVPPLATDGGLDA